MKFKSLFRLLALAVILTFSSEQILFASPGGEGLLLSSPTGGYGSELTGEEKGFHSPPFFSPKTPYRAIFEGLPKTSSLKQAGFFKKLFKKIARFFQKVFQAIVKAIQKVTQWITKALTKVFGKTIGRALAGLLNTVINILTFPVHVAYYASQGDWKGLFKYMGQMALHRWPSLP